MTVNKNLDIFIDGHKVLLKVYSIYRPKYFLIII